MPYASEVVTYTAALSACASASHWARAVEPGSASGVECRGLGFRGLELSGLSLLRVSTEFRGLHTEGVHLQSGASRVEGSLALSSRS